MVINLFFSAGNDKVVLSEQMLQLIVVLELGVVEVIQKMPWTS